MQILQHQAGTVGQCSLHLYPKPCGQVRLPQGQRHNRDAGAIVQQGGCDSHQGGVAAATRCVDDMAGKPQQVSDADLHLERDLHVSSSQIRLSRSGLRFPCVQNLPGML